MATEYAKLSLNQRPEGLYAVITASGVSTEKLLVPSKYPAPGWRLTKALRFAFNSGWQIAEGSLNWYMYEGMETRSLSREVEDTEDANLCPNGQDSQEEGDEIEESMGLRNRTEPEEAPAEAASEIYTIAAEDFRPGYRYWPVREGYENNWTIVSVTLAESTGHVYRDGEWVIPVIVTHTRRDGTTQQMYLGEQVAIQGPWKIEK